MAEFVSDEIKNLIINKSLEKYGLTTKDIKKQPVIDGVNWQEYYVLTEEEYKEWYHWCINMLEEKFPTFHPEVIKTKFLFEYASIYGLKTI